MKTNKEFIEEILKKLEKVAEEEHPLFRNIMLKHEFMNLIASAIHYGEQEMVERVREKLPQEMKMTSDNLYWGDTEFHSNSVRHGRNEAIAEIEALLTSNVTKGK